MKIETNQSIAIVNLSDKSYLVPMWLEVPVGTKLSDIEVVRPKPKVSAPSLQTEQYVTGSTGNEYLVRIWSDGRAECECWGYRRHKKDCKHIKALRG